MKTEKFRPDQVAEGAAVLRRGGLLGMLYREAKVEQVEYGETIDVTVVCGPRTLGQVQPFITE